MIDTISEKLAKSIKGSNPQQTASVAVIKHGIVIFINGISVLTLSLLIGWITGKFVETLLTLVSFAILRFFSGGLHVKSVYLCIFISTLLMTAIPHIPINDQMEIILMLVTVGLVALFAPSDIKGTTRIPERYHPWLKLVSILIVSANFVILSDILTKSFFAQALLLIKWRR